MAEVDGKVLEAVEQALHENPKATVDELFDVARKVNSAVSGLSKRQFHARYPLQVKRRMAPTKPRRPRRAKSRDRKARVKKPDAAIREAVRATFLKFAADLSGAEARKDLVRVVAGVDRYVDEVLKVTGTA